MQRNHPTLLLGALLGAAGVLAFVTPGRAQQQKFAPNLEIYTGGSAEAEGLKLGGWGSGMAVEDRGVKGPGQESIKVDTSGFYSGARLLFEQPREITEQKNDPYGFLEFTIKFTPAKPKAPRGSGGYPGSGGFPGGSGGYPGSGGFPGGSGGFPGGSGGFPGGSGGYPGGEFGGGFPGAPGSTPESLAPETKRMKVVLQCEEGTFVATNFPVTLNNAQDEGWYTVAVPFIAFKGLEKAETAKLKEIRLFGDAKDTFWIGQIRTTTDDEPISVDALDELEVSVNEPVDFHASGTGGISPLQYSWDFDLSDGIQEDATGSNVVHVFRKPSREIPGQPGELQPYVVTLTVRDLSGAKKPVRRQTNVIVNP